VRAKEWIDYFVEVMVDYVVRQQQPTGYVDDAKANWLMRWIDHDGCVDSLAELELLVKVLEVADSAPEGLRAYTLRQIEAAVTSGEGPTRTQREDGDGALQSGVINATEVELLRRAVFAMAGDGGYIVSQAEADMLFRLKDATLNGDNAPQWADFFVRAVGNHLMAHATYQPLRRDEQAGLDAYVADTHVSLGRFAKRVFGRRTDTRVPEVRPRGDISMDNAARIDPAEKSWLAAHIQADGAKDALEAELLNFIRRERSGL